jgi:hypothetical protein
VELKLVERRLFTCVRMLEKCCGTAKYCNQTGPSIRTSNEQMHAVNSFEIRGSDIPCTASHLKYRALQSTAESAIVDRPFCTPGQTGVTSSFHPAHRGRTGFGGRAECRDSGSFARSEGFRASSRASGVSGTLRVARLRRAQSSRGPLSDFEELTSGLRMSSVDTRFRN